MGGANDKTKLQDGTEDEPKGDLQEDTVDGGKQEAPALPVEPAPDYEAVIAERDERIGALEAQVAEAARTTESAEDLTNQIAQLKAEATAEREEFSLKLAGVRNVKAARALLADHDGDVTALKEAEPWLFGQATPQTAPQGTGGATGLPSAGAATDDNRELKRWRSIAGLEDQDTK
jgi:hypothetical protein